MKRIDSDALEVLTKALGLTGAGAPVTELADGVVDQSLDVVPIVRRSRTLGITEGLYTAIISNIHGAANTLTTALDPYRPGAALVISPFPAEIPPQFDLWLLTATMRRQSGTGTVNATLAFQPGARDQAWGVTDAGVAVVQQDMQVIAYWNTLVTSNTTFGYLSGTSPPLIPLGIRLPRGNTAFPPSIRFVSAASAIATYNVSLNFGLFPVSLGQDGLV